MAVQEFYYKSRGEWLELREEMSRNLKIGASDTSTALGVNKYKSAVQLFYNILGIYNSKFESLRMSLGLKEEYVNKACYEAFSSDEMVFAVNLKDDIKANKVRLVNMIAISDQFPIIAASLDFKRPKNQPALVESSLFSVGEIIPFSYPIDAKNTNENYYRLWPKGDRIPETYKCQLHAQMIATETKYSELSVKVDSSQYHIIPCVYDEQYALWMKQELLVFYRRLVDAFPLATLLLEARANNDYDSEAIYTSMIANLEPPLSGSESENDFLNDFYGATADVTLKGTDADLILAKRYKKAHNLEKAAQSIKTAIKGQVIHKLSGKEQIVGDEYKMVHRVQPGGREYFSIKIKD